MKKAYYFFYSFLKLCVFKNEKLFLKSFITLCISTLGLTVGLSKTFFKLFTLIFSTKASKQSKLSYKTFLYLLSFVLLNVCLFSLIIFLFETERIQLSYDMADNILTVYRPVTSSESDLEEFFFLAQSLSFYKKLYLEFNKKEPYFSGSTSLDQRYLKVRLVDAFRNSKYPTLKQFLDALYTDPALKVILTDIVLYGFLNPFHTLTYVKTHENGLKEYYYQAGFPGVKMKNYPTNININLSVFFSENSFKYRFSNCPKPIRPFFESLCGPLNNLVYKYFYAPSSMQHHIQDFKILIDQVLGSFVSKEYYQGIHHALDLYSRYLKEQELFGIFLSKVTEGYNTKKTSKEIKDLYSLIQLRRNNLNHISSRIRVFLKKDVKGKLDTRYFIDAQDFPGPALFQQPSNHLEVPNLKEYTILLKRELDSVSLYDNWRLLTDIIDFYNYYKVLVFLFFILYFLFFAFLVVLLLLLLFCKVVKGALKYK